MYEALRYRFNYDDRLIAPLIAQSKQLRLSIDPALDIKYSADERRKAERDFEPMLRLLEVRLGSISRDDRSILGIAHKIRRDTFHRGFLREEILQPVCTVLFRTVAGLTVKLKHKSMSHGELSNDEKNFLARSQMQHPSRLIDDDEVRRISGMLIDGIPEPNGLEFAKLFSEEIGSRIEESLGGLREVGRSDDEERLNMLLNHEEFSGEKSRELSTLRPGSDLETEMFRTWMAEGNSRFSVRKIKVLQRKARLIRTLRSPAQVLSLYWNVETAFGGAGARISKIVSDYDEWVNLQVDIARGK